MEEKSDNSQAQADDPPGRCGPYSINGWREVLFYLQGIQKQNLLVNVSLPGSKNFIISSILEIDEDQNEILLDSIENHPINRHAMSHDTLRAEAWLDQIRITFDSPVKSVVAYEGRPAIKVEIPTFINRYQRRQYFRIKLPLANPVQCMIPQSANTLPSDVTLQVADISLGGIALSDQRNAIDPQTGDVLHQCEIALPDIGMLTVDLLIHNIAVSQAKSGLKKKRIGCSFVDLPPAMSATLQRYITKLERERIACR